MQNTLNWSFVVAINMPWTATIWAHHIGNAAQLVNSRVDQNLPVIYLAIRTTVATTGVSVISATDGVNMQMCVEYVDALQCLHSSTTDGGSVCEPYWKCTEACDVKAELASTVSHMGLLYLVLCCICNQWLIPNSPCHLTARLSNTPTSTRRQRHWQ